MHDECLGDIEHIGRRGLRQLSGAIRICSGCRFRVRLRIIGPRTAWRAAPPRPRRRGYDPGSIPAAANAHRRKRPAIPTSAPRPHRGNAGLAAAHGPLPPGRRTHWRPRSRRAIAPILRRAACPRQRAYQYLALPKSPSRRCMMACQNASDDAASRDCCPPGGSIPAAGWPLRRRPFPAQARSRAVKVFWRLLGDLVTFGQASCHNHSPASMANAWG